MSQRDIKISVGEISDMEARVYARYETATTDERIEICGTLRGPLCELARTLPAEFAFHDLGPAQPGKAEAVVTEPCLWSEELPHLYQADLEAVRGGEVLATFHGKIGLRRAASSGSDQ